VTKPDNDLNIWSSGVICKESCVISIWLAFSICKYHSQAVSRKVDVGKISFNLQSSAATCSAFCYEVTSRRRREFVLYTFDS
jgi:hypothetical protein